MEKKLILDFLVFQHGKSYGFEGYLLNILTYLVEHRQDIHAERIIICCQDSQVEFFRTITDNKFEICGFQVSSIISRFKASRELPKKLSATIHDVIFYPANYMPYFTTTSALRVMTIHDLLYRHSEYCSSSLRFKLFRYQRYLYIPRSLKKADSIIAISNFTKNEVIETYQINKMKIQTVYNYFNFGKYDDGSDRTISNINGNFYLSVCSSQKHKNHSILLKAFRVVAQKDNEVKFVLVGDLNQDVLPLYNSLDENIKNRFIMVKHISNSDFKYLYSNAIAYISASKYEGLGMPIVEALYFGLPAFLSDLEIHREVSFNKAKYFDSDDWEKLAEYMSNNYESPNLKDLVIERYKAENTSRRYLDVFNRLLNR